MIAKITKIGLHFFIVLLLLSKVSTAQVFLAADSTQDPYSLIKSKGYGIEETTLHPGFKHVTQMWDEVLNKEVFAFTMHRDIDGDGDKRIDRQRLEMKTYGPSPNNMKAGHGETHYYRWKFKLDANFQSSTNFCHIHQLKAGDGPDAGSPLMTITPRHGTPDHLQLIYTPSSGTSGGGTVKQVDLAPFKGEWIEACERVVFNDPGEYHLVLRQVKDDAVLFEYESNSLDLWREASTFIRPKFGIYRSLNSLSYLRDEQVLFADFSLTEGTTFKTPDAPSNVSATDDESGTRTIHWTDNSNNEDQFRIDVSSDGGTTWEYLTTAAAGTNQCTVPKTKVGANDSYRVRAENTLGNSGFAVSGVKTGLKLDKQENVFRLISYPNPFREETRISFTIPVKSKIKLSIYNPQGTEVQVLLDGEESSGEYTVNWSPEKFSGLNTGYYFAKLETEDSSACIRILNLE